MNSKWRNVWNVSFDVGYMPGFVFTITRSGVQSKPYYLQTPTISDTSFQASFFFATSLYTSNEKSFMTGEDESMVKSSSYTFLSQAGTNCR